MRNFCPKVPYVLVGCKADLREDADTVTRLRQRKSEVVRTEEVSGCVPGARPCVCV